jgi:hypothetical protein
MTKECPHCAGTGAVSIALDDPCMNCGFEFGQHSATGNLCVMREPGGRGLCVNPDSVFALDRAVANGRRQR